MISEELFKFIQSQGSYTGTIAGKIPKSGDRIILEKLIIRYENNSYDGDVAKFYEKIWNKNDMCTSKIDYYNRRGKCKSFNANKYTELYEWCLVGNLDMVKYLIEIGTNPNGLFNIIRIATSRNYINIVEYLISIGVKYDIDELFIIACRTSLEMTKYCIGLGANYQANDNKAFYECIEYGKCDIFEYLILLGLDPNKYIYI